MNFQQQIESSLFKKREKTGMEVFHELAFVFAKEFGWTHEDLGESPTPFVLAMVAELEDYKKKEAAAYKKRGRK